MSERIDVRPYPKKFRKQVAQLGDRSAHEVAREFGISVDSARR